MNEEKMQRMMEGQKRSVGLVELEMEQRAAQHEMIALLSKDAPDTQEDLAAFKRANDRMAASRDAIIKFMAGNA